MNNFIDNLEKTALEDFYESVTENGAIGYRTSGKKLLDLNFSVTSLRNKPVDYIKTLFMQAFNENKLLAIKWLFFASDVRGGLGERRLFRACMSYIAEHDQELAKRLLPLIPHYSRWDNVVALLDSCLKNSVIELIENQLDKDQRDMTSNKEISLCAKWLPSANTSSAETRRLAKILISGLNMTEKTYRKTLSKLRAYLNIVEIKMSKNEWQKIDYATIPSRANLLYSNAFLKHDTDRRKEYLSALQRGETKINSGVLFPHDIVHKYNYYVGKLDIAIEEMWKALPDFVNGNENTICVADGSGSMCTSVSSNSRVACIDVANALAIYFSERSSGQFKDKYITFSTNPQLVDFSNCKSLFDKLELASSYCEISNTDIMKVFNLILRTAVKNNMKQSDLPKNILILSDMEFDCCVNNADSKLFSVIEQRYKEHGYQLPRLIFWNICSRTNTIPVIQNPLGVALVSGFSPAIAKMVLSNSTDPYECLLEQLNSERYDLVEAAIKG